MVNEFGTTQPVRQSRPLQHNYPASRGYVGLIIIGIIILLVGGIISVSWGLLDDPDESPYSMGSSDNTDQEEYEDNCRIIRTIGSLIMFVGVIPLGIGLVIGAINDDSLHPNTRLGLLIALGLIVGFKIASFLSYYVGY
jgi:hypothetical protein